MDELKFFFLPICVMSILGVTFYNLPSSLLYIRSRCPRIGRTRKLCWNLSSFLSSTLKRWIEFEACKQQAQLQNIAWRNDYSFGNRNEKRNYSDNARLLHILPNIWEKRGRFNMRIHQVEDVHVIPLTTRNNSTY